MAEEDRVEDSFFQKSEKQDTGSGYYRQYQKPPSVVAKVAIGAGIVGVAAAILIFTRSADQALIWVINPGPEMVHVEVGPDGHDIEPGKLVEQRVEVEDGFEMGAFRGEQTEDIPVTLEREEKSVSLVDLGGDAAYVIADVSSFYAEPPGKSYPIIHESTPKRVHQLPYPPTKLVRPGRPLPEKGSWELTVFQSPNKGIEMYKVFRIDPKRLEDKAKLVEVLSEAVRSKQTAEYENLRVIVADAPPAQ